MKTGGRFKGFARVLLLLVLVTLWSGAPGARADDIWTVDCAGGEFDFKNVFDKNEPICVYGNVTTKINPFDFYPCADVYIVPNQSWSGGEGLADAMGSNNRLCAAMMGGYFDGVQVIAMPPKVTVGKYDLVYDNNQDAIHQPGELAVDAGPGFAFEVVDLGHPAVDMSALKGAASAIGHGYTDAIDTWNDAMSLMDAMGIGLSLMSGDVVGAAIGVVSHFTGIPTDYNGWVIYYATAMIGGYDPTSTPKKASGIYGNLAKHWADLAADPPDPNFQLFAAADLSGIVADMVAHSVPGSFPTSYPVQVQGTDPREEALIRIVNRAIEQGALVKALRQSYEKYQGALAVSNYEWAYRQLEMAQQYIDLLSQNLAAYRNDLDYLKAVLTSQGMADKVIDVSGLQALKDRMNGTGITPEEIAALKAVGFSDARIQLLVDYVKVINVPSGNFTLGGSIDTLSARVTSTLTALDTAYANNSAAMANLATEPGFALLHPIANAGGPYTGQTGVSVTFDGGGSAPRQIGNALSYAWDFTGNGLFSDATGQTAAHTWTKPFAGLIGLKVTDQTNGRSTVGYAKVTITDSNHPPVIVSFTPPDTAPKASVKFPLTFSVAATDAEGDPLSYQWTVDGVSVGSGTSYTLAPAPGDTGTRTVMVSVTDNVGAHLPVREGRLATIYLDCDPGIPSTMTTYYQDADGDGWGDPTQTQLACAAPAGFVTNALDCNDAVAAIGAATERFYRDADGDGWGNPSVSTVACTVPAGYVTNKLDCDDTNPGVGQATQKYYRDLDGDGFGDPGSFVVSCSAPAGYVANSLDCNDSDPAVGNDISTYFRDADGDGYGDPGITLQACLAPAGYVKNSLDCNDADPYVNPGQAEIRDNGKDDDCSAATLDNWSKSFIVGLDDGNRLYYAKSNGDGTFSNYRYIGNMTNGSATRGVAIQDFNGDGFLDFVAGSGNGEYHLFLNDGTDNFVQQGTVGSFSNGGWAMDMAAGDFNNDGLMDFLANGNSNVTSIFLNDGKGGFTRTQITHSYTARGIDTADFNGDGNLDFAISFYGTNDAWLFTGDGKGAFSGKKIGTATSEANDNYGLAAADFDGDGKADIIVNGSSNGDAYLFKGVGDGSFAAGVPVPSLDMGGHSSIDAYDFNGDGKADIVLGEYNTGLMYFYPGNGDGSFGARTQINASRTSSALLSMAAPPSPNPAPFPVAAAHPKNLTVKVGDPVAFTGAYSVHPPDIASYDWKFGDATTGAGAALSHPFASEGRFAAALTVTDLAGRKDTDVARVTVQGAPPVANAGGPYLVGESGASLGRYTVNLNGSASTDDYGIAKYDWEFGDGLLENFDAGSAAGWTAYAGSWGVSGGAYRQTDASLSRTDTLIGNVKAGDYTVEADLMLLSGAGQEAQLIFRALDSNNHYEFIFRPRANDLLLYRQNGGGFSQLAQTPLPFAPQLNTWYHLKVEAYDSRIRCYVDGSLYIDASDTSTSRFATGQIGLSTYQSAAQFDNVRVTSRGTGATPTHLYPEGSFTATLTVTDGAGQQSSATAQVDTVKGNPPTARTGGPYTFGETYAFQGKWAISLDGSTSSDDTGIESYAWNFGDGGTGTGAKPSHTYTSTGTYTVTLTVTDKSGQANTASTTVTIAAGTPPVPVPGGPYTVTEDLVVDKHWSITANGSASSDDVAIWTYKWDFGDGTSATTASAAHTYGAPGSYTLTLTVTDHAGQARSATTTASVTGTAAPTAKAGGPYFTEPNLPVLFSGEASSDNTGIYSYAWDFGDGKSGKGATPTHSYGSPGTYPVTLTVKDAALQSATDSTTVTVAVGEPPIADAGGPYGTTVGLPVRLNGSASSDDYGIASYLWQVGDATPVLEDSFTGTAIDDTKWLHSATGVTQNGLVTFNACCGWGYYYLFSKTDFVLDGNAVLTGQMQQNAGGYLMFGFKNTSGSFSYEQMPYALYLNNGNFSIYESGASRGSVGSYSFNVLYDLKVELKSDPSGAVGGARYYYKPAGAADWILLYDSSYAPGYTSFKAGATHYQGSYTLDNVSLTTGAQFVSGERPVVTPSKAGSFPVRLTVTDGAGQSSSATSTLTVSGDLLAITVPWQYSGKTEVPHDTWSGQQVILKGVVKGGRAPMTYSWDFGDGTSTTGSVTNRYDLSARHSYSAPDNTPFQAKLTVTDADLKTHTAVYPIIVRPKSLNVEVNKAIDDGLWYLHTTQIRPSGAWQSSGWSNSYYASPTASAVHAMEINGHLELGDFARDPYAEDVWRGLQYTFTTLGAQTIAEQPYGDPDLNGNGIGLQVATDRPIYETGQVMMALVASGTPTMKASAGGSWVNGRSYRDLVRDMAEMYYWGQVDDGYPAGGWRYGWNGDSDNSASQWAAMGFLAAQEQNWIQVPKWVKNRNVVWLGTSRSWDGKGFGYSGPGNDIATTPSGMAQLAFADIPTTDSRWQQVENFLASTWNSWYNGTGNYYALYSLAKALRTAKPSEVVTMGSGTPSALDWYNDPTRGVARILVDQQDHTSGVFSGGGGSHWVEGAFRTAWGTIILTKTLFVLPPVAVAGENQVWGIDWPLTFDGSKSYHLDPSRKIVKYEWDFDGDGTFDFSSATPTATHTYDTLGTYKVTLKVTDDNTPAKFATDTLSVIVAIPPHPPVAVPGGPYLGYAGIPVQLDGSASYDIDPTDLITSYGWELDGAFPFDFADATTAKPTHTWNTPGTYNIGLKVYDNGVLNPPAYDKLSDTRWSTITIRANNPPVARAGGPYTVNEGSLLTLDGTGSSDPDGNALTYRWDLDQDGVFESVGPTPSFTRPDNGSFTVTLKVSDGALESTDSATVTVLNAPPTVGPIPAATIDEGGSYAGSASFGDPGSDSFSATVSFGDGSVQPLPLNPDKSFNLNHVYAQNGVYAVTVTVTDKDGGVGSATGTVTVRNVAPSVKAGPSATINEGGSFAASGSFTDPGVLDSFSATVDYGDGSVQPLPLNPDQSFSLSHLYPQNGLFTVTVTVTDSDGGSGTATLSVTVLNVAPVVDAGPGGTIGSGTSFAGAGSFVDPGSDSFSATVDYGDGSGSQPLALGPGKSFLLNHLYAAPGSYTVKVTVSDGDGGSGSGTTTVVVVSTSVQTITNLVAKPKPYKADLIWSCVPGNVTYNIYRGTTAGGPYTQIMTGHTSTYCTYANYGLTNGVTYFWRVTSVDGSGLESLYSNEASATPRMR